MTNQGFGTLANLAKILEDASDPESQVREDRREAKPKAAQKAPAEERRKKVMDPKRKAWYEKRLKEQLEGRQAAAARPAAQPAAAPTQTTTRATAASVSGGLQSALAAAREAKPKDGSKRPEPWKRKPGDPLF